MIQTYHKTPFLAPKMSFIEIKFSYKIHKTLIISRRFFNPLFLTSMFSLIIPEGAAVAVIKVEFYKNE